MSHIVFQTAQIMPINIQISTKTLPPPNLNPLLPFLKKSVSCPISFKHRRCQQVKPLASSTSVLVDGDSVAALERCFSAPPSTDISSPVPCSSSYGIGSSGTVSGPVMKVKYGAFGTVTLEKSKLQTSQKQSKSNLETAIGGGDGGIGKNISHGGGGSNDDGDDDNYFDDFNDGDDGDEGGLFRKRKLLEELFDRKFIDAVLNEWQRTMMDLPAGFRQACEMGLVSSAQIVNFLAVNARPTTGRFISRALPQGLSRALIGRTLADPAFLHKFLLEQISTTGWSVCWELKNRKDRIRQEWDLALINVLTASACNAIIFWSLAPCRSYGNTFRFDLQNTLQKLPNNIFEKSYPLREFDLQKRIQSFIYKAAELCTVGLTAGAVQGVLSNLSARRKEGRLSVTIPTLSTGALGYGAFLGLYANLRYQLLFGLDRALTNHFDVIGVSLFFGTALRLLNVQLGETSRLAWLGVEADPLAQSDDLLKVYSGPSGDAVSGSSSKWFISKNAIVSGLGLLGMKHGNTNSGIDGGAAPVSKARRKRIVKKKVAASSAAV